METEVKLTKLASCAGCGAKVGAGTLVKLLDGFRTHSDPRLLVGYDKSDDASVYYLDENTALVQTTDFFPPIVDDPFLYGQIAAANAISDVYAMGGEPKLALNILCLPESMTQDMVQELLRGGYDKAYEAGAIITGGHTIHGAEPIYGLAVSGFVDPRRILTNSGARPGDVLLLTKPLGVGVLTTAAKAGLAGGAVMDRIYRQMATLNRTARDIMVKYRVHSCTDVTGFALLGHSFEMAQGSGCTVHIQSGNVPFHPEAWDLAAMGLIPAGAYRNRDYAEKGVTVRGNVSRTMQDLLYDPQTSGGLLIALPEAAAHVRTETFDDAVDVPPGFDARAKGDDQIRHVRGKAAGLLAHGGVHEDLRTELAQARAIFVHQQGQGLSGLPEGTAGGRIGAQTGFESFHPGLAFEDRLGKDHQTADGTRPGALQQHEPVQARVPQFQGHTGAHVSGTPDDDKGTESFLHHDKNASCRASRQGPGDARTGCLCPVPGRRMVACTRVPGLMPEEETTRKERS